MSDKLPKEQFDTDTILEDDVREPKRYKVLLHNDDYTTMEFVILVLKVVFNKTDAEATRVMLHVHEKGKGVCGIYTAEVAETKVSRVQAMAREAQYPLKSTMEEV